MPQYVVEFESKVYELKAKSEESAIAQAHEMLLDEVITDGSLPCTVTVGKYVPERSVEDYVELMSTEIGELIAASGEYEDASYLARDLQGYLAVLLKHQRCHALATLWRRANDLTDCLRYLTIENGGSGLI